MFIKKIKYTDFNGTEREEEFQFNLTKAETMEWLMTDGDYTLASVFTDLVTKQNGRGIIDAIKHLIYMAYGERSLDGRRFTKTDEVKANFMETEAYSVLFTELVSDSEKAIKFIQGIIPQDFSTEIEKILKDNPDAIPENLREYADKIKEAQNEAAAPALTPVN